MFDRIKRWWRWHGKYYISDFRLGIKNLIVWSPVIFKDRDWDDSFFFDIIKFKLQKQIQYWEKGTRIQHVGMEYDIWLMKIAVKLIDIVKDEKYSTDAYGELEKRWGKLEMRFEPYNGPNADGKFEEGMTELFFDRDNVLTKEDEERYDADYKKTMDIAHKKEAKAKKLLFRILEERVLYWWI